MPSRMSSEPDFWVISFQPRRGEGSGSARKYQRRKTHQKSKTGCLSCKLKRVKCDEARPSCSRCRRNSVWCSYTTQDSGSCKLSGQDEAMSTMSGHKLSRLGCLESSPAIYGFDPEIEHTRYGTPRRILMNHFQYLFLELQVIESVELAPILSLGICRPFLLDSIFAVSASHLRFQSVSNASHRVAEYFQQALAIKNFQGALASPLDQQTADALLLTAMFLNMLSFSAVEDEDVGNSWVYNNHPDRLGWLSLSLGIKPLIYATETFRENTILNWLLESSDDEVKSFHGSWGFMHLRDIPAHWLDLVGMTRDSQPDAKFFHPIRILSETSKLEPSPKHFFPYVNMIGSLDVDFRTELERRDEIAMWLMGYWLGLLLRYDFWWLRKRVRRDFRAVCRKLVDNGVRDRTGAEGAMWRKLVDDLEKAPYWKSLEHGGLVCEEV